MILNYAFSEHIAILVVIVGILRVLLLAMLSPIAHNLLHYWTCPLLSQYDKLSKLIKDFEPFRNLWVTASDWLRWHESWMNDPLMSIDAESVEKNVNDAYKTMHKSVKIFQDIPGIDKYTCVTNPIAPPPPPHTLQDIPDGAVIKYFVSIFMFSFEVIM